MCASSPCSRSSPRCRRSWSPSIASITLDIGLDRWFEIRTKTIINSSLSIAEAYVQENARNLQGTTLSMAYDLDNAAHALRSRPHRLSRLHEPAGRRPGAGACRADPRRRLVRHERADTLPISTCRSRRPRRVEQAADGQAGADRAAHHATSSARSSSCARSTTPISTRSASSIREVIRARQIVTANTDEYRGLEANRRTTQIAFALLYLGIDADHRPVGDLDRHRRRRPAGAADPPADRRGRRGGDRQSRRLGAGARRRTATSPRSATPSTRCSCS